MTTIAQPFAGASPDAMVESERADAQQQGGFINIGSTERAVSTATGMVLAVAGLSRRSLPGVAVALLGGGLIYRGASGHCDILEALGIDRSDRARGAEPEDYFERGIHVEESTTINRSPWDLYSYWRKLDNLPSIMSHLESVIIIDEERSHWVATAPSVAGGKVDWDAEIINDEPNALLAWRSLPGADVDNAGSVRFVPAPGDRGTDVKVVLDYIPPAGQLGRWIATLLGGDPGQQIREDLCNFKRMIEARKETAASGG